MNKKRMMIFAIAVDDLQVMFEVGSGERSSRELEARMTVLETGSKR